MADSRNFKRN